MNLKKIEKTKLKTGKKEKRKKGKFVPLVQKVNTISTWLLLPTA